MSLFLFFFKQKTAYEITYGDWSSDVCSSDLRRFRPSMGASILACSTPSRGWPARSARWRGDRRPADLRLFRHGFAGGLGGGDGAGHPPVAGDLAGQHDRHEAFLDQLRECFDALVAAVCLHTDPDRHGVSVPPPRRCRYPFPPRGLAGRHPFGGSDRRCGLGVASRAAAVEGRARHSQCWAVGWSCELPPPRLPPPPKGPPFRAGPSSRGGWAVG